MSETNSSIDEIFSEQKSKAQALRLESVEIRRLQLKKLRQILQEHENEIIEAHLADFKKPADETWLTEIFPVYEELALFLKNLKKWSKPQSVKNPPLMLGSKSQVHYEPKGRVLVIAPWNYPFSLSLVPLIGAIGAGNTVILKPSELTPHVSQILKKIIQKTFPQDLAAVFEGGVEVSQKLLSLPFDHIFFTGSIPVGKLVMQAAAKNLVPVTLELGGKSPVIVDSNACLKDSAEKIIWGKSLNGGQTCVSPDYVYVHAKVWDEFLVQCQTSLQQMQHNHSRPQIITSKHFQRQLDLKFKAVSAGAKIISDGTSSGDRDLSPVLMEVNSHQYSSEIMSEEIFGPLLPLLRFESSQEVIEHINSQGKPLSLYIFSQHQDEIKNWIKSIPSGGVCINNTILHVGNHHLPFGGIGASGMGKYHGHYSFLEFSHHRAILKFRWTHKLMRQFYPPYSSSRTNLLRTLIHFMTRS